MPESRRPTEAEMRQISDIILQRSHLAPLICPFISGPEGVGRLAFNISIDVHKMHPSSERESVIAIVMNSDADHENIVGPGRIVYGELEAGGFKYFWETPLLKTWFFQMGYVDLLRSGNLQIIMTSAFGNNGQYTLFYAFDLDGAEISRQSDACDRLETDGLDKNSTVCPIFGTDTVEINSDVKGPKELLVTDERAKKIRYVFSNGRYQEVRGPKQAKKPAPPSDPRATGLNKEGMQLMEQKNYEAAIAKFEEAAMLNSAESLFANNAGFAYYKMGKYVESLYWFNKTIEIDPERAVAYLNLGDSLAKVNRNAEARQAYTKYLELAPDSKSAPDVKKKLDLLPLSR
jgi:hypothetical protein